MKLLKKLSFSNILAIIGIIIAVLTFFTPIIFNDKTPIQGNVIQTTSGDNSPVINSDKDVDIRF